MTTKINVKIIQTSELEAVILTDEALPVSQINKIKKESSSVILISDNQSFEINGTLTGLERVLLWSNCQDGKVLLEAPKTLEWTI